MKGARLFEEVGRPVYIFPELTKIAGGLKENILLCQLIHWTERQEDGKGEWISKTQKEIKEETGLSRCEQENARKNLKAKGFLEERYAGIPCKLYFRLNLDKIKEAWEKWLKEKKGDNPTKG